MLFVANQHKVMRFFEIAFPLIVWSAVTMPLWLSPFKPSFVAYFILLFNVYFFYKSFTTMIFSSISYVRLHKLSKVDWLSLAKTHKDYGKIYHGILITNFSETIRKVDKTLKFISCQDFPVKKIIIVLAMEEREGKDAKERAAYLENKYRGVFAGIYSVFHPDIEGEVKGKASNSTYAAKFLSKKIRERGIDPQYVTITSCDADSLMPAKYFSYLTNLFLNDKERYYHFYWAPVLLYSNFWEVKLPIRIQATISSIARLASLSKPDTLIQISTYSLSIKMLEDIGYWDTDIIPEDWHIFLQAFFTKGEKVKTVPIYLTISRDAVNASGLINTLKSRYEQEKRWAWGVTDVPYALYKLFTTPKIPFLVKFFRVLYVVETHFLWPTSFFILTIAASIPAIINPNFSRTALGYNLPRISGLILTITTLFLIALIILDAKSRPKRPAHFSIAKTPLLIFQWVFLPIVSFFFSSLPALDAHTRLLLGKRLEYKVTEKV